MSRMANEPSDAKTIVGIVLRTTRASALQTLGDQLAKNAGEGSKQYSCIRNACGQNRHRAVLVWNNPEGWMRGQAVGHNRNAVYHGAKKEWVARLSP